MPEDDSGFLGRLLGRRKKGLVEPIREELPISQPTIGLCFDYERGLAYDSEYLSDVGLDQVMKTLDRHGLRATFNCPAKLCETAPNKLKLIVEAGHELAVLGYADESPHDLADDALKQMVYTCRNAFLNRGYQPIGFRSPHSRWDERLPAELVRQRFVYNAEHEHARHPYILLPGDPPLVRIPVRTDDRALRSRKEKRELAVSKHHRVVRKAIQDRHFVTIGFHPWILAENVERMRHWEEWLETAIRSGAKVLALEDILPARYRNAESMDD
ncbi:MAG: polysaccharide deacetylase family protein [Phycisphaerae bacterium]|nr:polysaccharide deacetylase family protein [Phycisphaerae bacterium]